MTRFDYFCRKLMRECVFAAGWLFGGREYLRVVIVTRSRSGSNLLCSLLESHPRAFVWREIFRRPHYFTVGLTERLVHGRYLRRFRVVAYKVFYGHRVPEGYWSRLLGDKRVRIIHLVRKNYLDTYVSQMQAFASGQWEAFESPGTAGKAERPTIDINDLMLFLDRNDQQIEEFSRKLADRPGVLTLTFDELTEPAGHMKVLDFLQDRLDPRLFGNTKNTRQGPVQLGDRIVNARQVRLALLNSRWAHLVDSTPPDA